MSENGAPERRLQLAGEVLKVLDASCPQEQQGDKVEALLLALVALTHAGYVIDLLGAKAR